MLIGIVRMVGIPASAVCAILEFETRRRQIAGLSWDWNCSCRITVNPEGTPKSGYFPVADHTTGKPQWSLFASPLTLIISGSQ